MDSSLLNEEKKLSRSSIYLKIRRKNFDQKALVPTCINIQRRSTLHSRIEKPFDEAYNNSPRTRIAKMIASRKTSESKNITTKILSSESPSSDCFSHKKIGFDSKSNIQNKMLLKVSNLCEQERANTHKLLRKILHIQKNFIQTKINNQLPKTVCTAYEKKVLDQELKHKQIERRLTLTSRKLKENFIIPSQMCKWLN